MAVRGSPDSKRALTVKRIFKHIKTGIMQPYRPNTRQHTMGRLNRIADCHLAVQAQRLPDQCRMKGHCLGSIFNTVGA